MDFQKSAAFRVRNLQHLRDMLAKDIRGVDGGDVARAARNAFGEGADSGSLFINGTRTLLRKLPGVRKLGLDKKINKGIGSYRDWIVDKDLRLGNKITDALGKKHPKLERAFVETRKIKMADKPGAPLEYLEVETPSAFAPISKAKDAVIPLAGGLAVGDVLAKATSKPSKDGDEMNDVASRKQQNLNKVAALISGQPLPDASVKEKEAREYDMARMSKVASEAASALHQVSEVLRAKDAEIEKIAMENKAMALTMMAMARSERSVSLAGEMLEKGIIKSAEYDDKVDEIMEMGDKAYDLLHTTVRGIKKEARESANEGLTNLTFMSRDDTIGSGTRSRTMADGITEDIRNNRI